MIIDCESCEVRGNACGDCVIGVLLGVPGVPRRTADTAAAIVGEPPGAPAVQLDAPERRAIGVLAAQGLVPELRLVARSRPHVAGGGEARDVG